MLLHDQQLIPRLRSLKHFFFLYQSSFLTHFLDISHNELRKSARSVSLPKLQSLLEISLSLDTGGYHHAIGAGETAYKDDIRVTLASSGLYEWLLKIVSVNGVIGGDDDNGAGADMEEERKERDKDDKKQLLGR